MQSKRLLSMHTQRVGKRQSQTMRVQKALCLALALQPQMTRMKMASYLQVCLLMLAAGCKGL